MDDTQLAELNQLLAASALFDAAWYLQTYPDVALLGQDPIRHYLTLGWRLGRSPSVAFNGQLYLQLHQDVAAAAMNPLVHYLLFGQQEGRQLRPNAEPDQQPLAVDALADYVRQQLAELPSSTPSPALPQSIEQRLRLTQQQLEHYFFRCQSLDNEIRQLKHADPRAEQA